MVKQVLHGHRDRIAQHRPLIGQRQASQGQRPAFPVPVIHQRVAVQRQRTRRIQQAAALIVATQRQPGCRHQTAVVNQRRAGQFSVPQAGQRALVIHQAREQRGVPACRHGATVNDSALAVSGGQRQR